jgi:hypothetical protein
MIKNIHFICLTFFSFCLSSQSFVASYSFANVTSTSGTLDPGPVPVVSGLTFSSFSATGTSANANASGRFSFTGWSVGALDTDDNYANYTAALSPTIYYEVSLAVAPAYTLNLNAITFAVRRSGTGIRNYCVRSSLDNYTNNLAASTGTSTRLSVIPGDVFFWNYDSVSTSSDQKGSIINFGSQFSHLTNALSFRFYAWNSEANGGTFSIDNVSFTGSVTNIATPPNPAGTHLFSSAESEIEIYPNPSSDGNIIIKNNREIFKAEAFSVLGSLVLSQQAVPAEDKIELHLCDLPAGVYYIKTYSGKNNFSNKVILTHK